MTQPSTQTNSPEIRAIKTLGRSLSLSQNRFALIFVRSNSLLPEYRALDTLKRQYGIEPHLLELPGEASQLYPWIQQRCEQLQPSSLIVAGLDNHPHLNELLVSANQMRDEFRQQFPFPIVLWMNDKTIQSLIKLAPDFYSWASAPISLA